MATNDLLMALKMKVSFQVKNIYRFMTIVQSVKNITGKYFHRNPAWVPLFSEMVNTYLRKDLITVTTEYYVAINFYESRNCYVYCQHTQ
jgi:hypothetical protein